MNALSTTIDRAAAVHRELLAAVRDRRAADHRCAVLLAEVAREGHHRAHGHASAVAYAVEALGLPVRRVRALLQVGRRLAELPALEAAFAAGEVGWTQAREVVRVATAETDAAWVARARAVDSRTLERLVSATRVGQAPPEVTTDDRGPARVRLVFEVEAVEAQLVREALAWVRSQAGVHRAEVGDGALLAMVAQRVLHDGPDDVAPTGERWRVVVEACPTCGARCGRDHEVGETVALESACDAEIVDLTPGPGRGRLTRTIPPTTRRAVVHRDRERCRFPGCRCTLWLDVHHVVERHRGGDHAEANLVTLCPAHHRLVHDGVLAIRGRADGVLVFERADGERRVSDVRGRPAGPRAAVADGAGPAPAVDHACT